MHGIKRFLVKRDDPPPSKRAKEGESDYLSGEDKSPSSGSKRRAGTGGQAQRKPPSMKVKDIASPATVIEPKPSTVGNEVPAISCDVKEERMDKPEDFIATAFGQFKSLGKKGDKMSDDKEDCKVVSGSSQAKGDISDNVAPVDGAVVVVSDVGVAEEGPGKPVTNLSSAVLVAINENENVDADADVDTVEVLANSKSAAVVPGSQVSIEPPPVDVGGDNDNDNGKAESEGEGEDTDPSRGEGNKSGEEEEGGSDCSSDVDIAPFPHTANGTISYEEQRQLNIQRNAAMLQSLGINNAKSSMALDRAKSKPAKKKGPKRASRASIMMVAEPRRRSTRNQKSVDYNSERISGMDDSNVVLAPPVEKTRDPIADFNETYDESNIFKYLADNSASESKESATKSDGNSTNLVRLKQYNPEALFDRSLKKIYTMDILEPSTLLACAGDGGGISIYGVAGDWESLGDKTLQDGAQDPFISFKGHRGWISSVRFITLPNRSSNMFLLSSSNDSVVSLWDLSKVSSKGMPLNMFSNTSLHGGGVFSMDALNDKVVTGSKDQTVCFSALTESEIQPITRFDEIHDGVVKCVHLRDGNTFASTGNDCRIQVTDSRLSSPAATISDAGHGGQVVNSVRWHPSNGNLLSSTSFDDSIQVWDIRNKDTALFKLTGHVGSVKSKGKIYHPVYFPERNTLLTHGQGSHHITQYSLDTGKIISQGFLGYEPHTLQVSKCMDKGGVKWRDLVHLSRRRTAMEGREIFEKYGRIVYI